MCIRDSGSTWRNCNRLPIFPLQNADIGDVYKRQVPYWLVVKTLVYNGIKKKEIILEPILPSVKINVFFNKYLFLDSLPILNISL